ncbi:hypothetical protein MNBD_GAMMA04-868 [hydrothermal vent metagenome]|uniref:Blue (type 1) copper domain-containing protein n=1 Tax=hydrothermal vent metagenome TaxID=652676 RepID=A0A3B0WG57_9ZZZZ
MQTIFNRPAALGFFALSLFVSGMLQGAEHKVGMEFYEFTPAELTIQVGETVTWLNGDDTDHDLAFYEVKPVNAPTKNNPQDIRVGEKYSFVFNQAGVFKYVCKIHRRQDMKGIITVE